jgi:uncharacterized protein (UPF0276 family)
LKPFLERVHELPFLGLGISTEYEAALHKGALDPLELQAQHPEYLRYLEVGVELVKGLDEGALAWVKAGLPTTYHYLDINLNDPEDFSEDWLKGVCEIRDLIKPAWLCGDLGLWHFGERDRGQMLLLPPILTKEAASDYAKGIARLRCETGLEVLPENPPGQVFLGDLDLLEFFKLMCEEADTGMLLDCAHLAIYQGLKNRRPLEGLLDFPLERIIEIHVAGGSTKDHNGFHYIDDSHIPEVGNATWEIVQHVVQNAPNLKAITYECERNPIESVKPVFKKLSELIKKRPHGVAQ